PIEAARNCRRAQSIEHTGFGQDECACADRHDMRRSLHVRLHPLDELRIFRGPVYSATGDKQDVSRRAVDEGIVGDKLLTESSGNRLTLFGDGENSEPGLAEYLPGPGVID